MVNKRNLAVLIGIALVACSIMTSCVLTSPTEVARETVPKTVVTLQRVKSTTKPDLPMQIIIDDISHELSNGAITTIVVNNGEHIVYAVMGETETKSVRFTANSMTIAINVTPKEVFFDLFGDGLELAMEVK